MKILSDNVPRGRGAANNSASVKRSGHESLLIVRSLGIALALVGVSPTLLYAQDTAPNPSPSAASASPADNTDQLQEVVVTAERRAVDVQNTAISMDVISGDQLVAQHVENINDLQNATPDFVVNSYGLSSYLNIRGIGESTLSPAITPGVAVFRDGLYQPESQGLQYPFYDVADTEVLRGPQGTFVGMSAAAGSLQINSQEPNFRGVNGYVEGTLGNYSDTRVDGAVNLPVNETLALRLAVNAEMQGSFYKNYGSILTPSPSVPLTDPGKVDNRNARLSLLWKPTENLQALLRLELNYLNNDGPPGSPNQQTFQVAAGQPCPAPADPAGGPCHSPYYAYAPHTPFSLNYGGLYTEDQQYNNKYSLELRYTLPGGVILRSLSGLQTNNILDTENASESSITPAQALIAGIQGAAGALYDNTKSNDYFSEEVNLISPNGPLNWVVGASVFYRRTPLYLVLNYVAPPIGVFPISIDDITYQRAEGIFGQVNWQFTDTLELQAGARANYDDNATRDFLTAANNVRFSDSVPTAKVGINWKPAPGQFIYAFFARGYTAGGAAQGYTFQPEHINDYELGWKSDMFDRRLQTSIGGYWMAYQNMQESIFNPANGQTPIVNVSTATIKGLEASVQGRLGGLGGSVNLAYNVTSLGDFVNYPTYLLPSVPAGASAPLQCPAGVTPPYPTLGPGGCLNYAAIAQNVSGDQNLYSPKITLDASLFYDFPLGSATMEPRVTYSHTDSQYSNLAEHYSNGQTIGYYLLPTRNLWNASLTYTVGPWLVELYGTNLSNEIYVTGTSGPSVYYGNPRQYGLRFNRSF